jgi:membrane protease YdiL (CAAX protease family)
VLGLCAAGAVLVGLGVWSIFSPSTPKDAQTITLFPRAPGEWPAFAAFALTVGCGWEVLYRGYLLWILAPWIGTLGAVAAASAAYGLAHGVADWRRTVGSLVAAALFTTGYAITRSLWWLMLLHTGLPILGALLTARSRHVAAAAAA